MIGDGDNMVLDDPDAQRVSTCFTFFSSTIDDICMGSNSHSAEIPSHFDKDFSSEGNAIVDKYFYLSVRILRGMVLAPTLVLLACVPLVQKKASN